MNHGNYSDGSTSKFFKPYLPSESGDDLMLPIYFNSCLPKPLPETVNVRSIYGKVWKLVLRKCGGEVERFVMVNGWKKIVRDEDLKGGDLLAFEFDGSRCFNLCIYERETMCKKLKRSSEQSEEIIEVGSDGEEETLASDDSDDSDNDYAVEDDDVAEDDDGLEDEDEVEAEDDDDVKAEDDDDNDERQYLDHHNNPYFTMTLNPKKKSQLHIPAYVIKDYDLNFLARITVMDQLGALEKAIKIQKNGSIFVKGFGSVIRRNKMKMTDKMICELKRTGSNLVHTIKVNIISG
ncbi:unnamed protein product [Arabidopsis lyrata]|nr:unnamed protein product [Arabidopsis lyrata]